MVDVNEGNLPLNELSAPMAPGEMAFLGSNRSLVVDGVTAEPALARKVAPKTNAWKNSQNGSGGKKSFALPKVADWRTAKWAICVDGTFPSRS
ncbi:MAG: hypothetical protein ACOYD0_08490 [Candidatus Nanopelagicales bacterium]